MSLFAIVNKNPNPNVRKKKKKKRLPMILRSQFALWLALLNNMLFKKIK